MLFIADDSAFPYFYFAIEVCLCLVANYRFVNV